MIELALFAAKAKAALATAHGAATMAGIMLDADTPPLCTNINHNQITCADSGLPRHKWCEACRSHAERNT